MASWEGKKYPQDSYMSVNICDTDVSPCSGLVPLHNACSYGHFEVTELLLKVSPTKTFISLLDELVL